MTKLVMRPALIEELSTLNYLSVVADSEKNYPRRRIDREEIDKDYKFMELFDKCSFYDPNEIWLVAEAPPFETKYPVYGANGRQLAGCMFGKLNRAITRTHFNLHGFNAVHSEEHLTGRFMMSHLINMAPAYNIKAIRLTTLHPTPTLWYKEALFEYKTKTKKPGETGDMVLYQNNFSESLAKLAELPANGRGKYNKSLDSAPLFP